MRMRNVAVLHFVEYKCFKYELKITICEAFSSTVTSQPSNPEFPSRFMFGQMMYFPTIYPEMISSGFDSDPDESNAALLECWDIQLVFI